MRPILTLAVLFVLFSCLASTAQAQSRWVLISTSPDRRDSTYVDTAGVVRADSLVRAWVRIYSHTPQPVPGVSGAMYTVSDHAYRVDCKRRRAAIEQERYSAVDGKSWRTDPAQDGRMPVDWKPPAGTVGATALNYLCKAPMP